MKTFFATPERTEAQELAVEIKTVNQSPVMSGLLHSVGGLLAILDEQRQILAINDSFLRMLGIDNPAEVLGLRPGEALQCIHADREPGGCGTSRYCSTCGAAIAILSSLKNNQVSEKICALTVDRADRSVDIAFKVRSHPTEIEGRKMLLLFLQDITIEQQRAALEKTFFHDINNRLSSLLGASEMLYQKDKQSDLARIIHQSSLRLKDELEMQKSLLRSDAESYQPLWQKIDSNLVFEDLRLNFINHPVAKNKSIIFPDKSSSVSIITDISLLLRILANMLINALEASAVHETVKVWLEPDDSYLNFRVWNRSTIDKGIALRIFQRNFSTKEGTGRGIGTYSMKLFGEQMLTGKVDFTSSEETGTIFTLSLPKSHQND